MSSVPPNMTEYYLFPANLDQDHIDIWGDTIKQTTPPKNI